MSNAIKAIISRDYLKEEMRLSLLTEDMVGSLLKDAFLSKNH